MRREKKYPIAKKAAALLLLLLPASVFAQDSYAYRAGKIKHRLSAGLVKSFYINHPKHTDKTKGNFGYTGAYHAEIFLGGKTNVMIGLEYLNQGGSFRGYYKKPGFTYLFDETFSYVHEFRVQEVQLPLLLKLSFNKEKDHPCSAYLLGGVGARYIFASYSSISNDSTGVTVYDAPDDIQFEHQRVTKGLSAYYQLGLGLQYNLRNNARAVFFEVNYKYGLVRLHYDGNEGSNDLNIKDAHLCFVIGMRI